MAVGHPVGGKRAFLTTVAVVIIACAVHYGSGADHSGIAIACAGVAVLAIFELVVRIGRRG